MDVGEVCLVGVKIGRACRILLDYNTNMAILDIDDLYMDDPCPAPRNSRLKQHRFIKTVAKNSITALQSYHNLPLYIIGPKTLTDALFTHENFTSWFTKCNIYNK